MVVSLGSFKRYCSSVFGVVTVFLKRAQGKEI